MARGRKKKAVTNVAEDVKQETKKDKAEAKEPRKSEKQETAEYLVSLGYKADVVNGVVIAYHEPGKGEGFFEKIGEILKDHGYNASYGTRVGEK